MTLHFIGRYDGKNIVLSESLPVPVNEDLELTLAFRSPGEATDYEMPSFGIDREECEAAVLEQVKRNTTDVDLPVIKSEGRATISAEELQRIIEQTQLEEDLRRAGLD